MEGKGQIDALKACQILYENNINFVFYLLGDFNDNKSKDDFMEFYKSLPFKNNIKLVGFTDNVGNYISQSDVFLFPSYGEGFGNSFAEALSAGLVCISYDNTTFPEFKKLGMYFHQVENKNIE